MAILRIIYNSCLFYVTYENIPLKCNKLNEVAAQMYAIKFPSIILI